MTDYLIRAALWQIPTMVINANKPVPELESSKLTMNAMNNLAAHERFRLLEDQVDDAVLAFARRPPAAGEKVVDLFVAPEYLFARSDVVHFNDEATKDRLLHAIDRQKGDAEIELPPFTLERRLGHGRSPCSRWPA